MADPDQIKPLKRSKHIRMCVYGDPGVGKTDFVGSTAQLGPTLLIRPPQDHTESIIKPHENLREWVINNWAEMNEAMDYLRMDGKKWFWVWVDSLSLLQDVLLDDIWETTVAEKPARARYGLDKQEYGINFLREGVWMRHIIGADLFNFGWTAHPMMLSSPDTDDDGDPVEKLMPWVQGRQMPQKFCGYVNLVGWIEKTSRGGRLLKTTSDQAHYAKDQYDALEPKGGKLVLPRGGGMPKLIEAIYKARPRLRPGTNKRTTAGRRSTRKTGR